MVESKRMFVDSISFSSTLLFSSKEDSSISLLERISFLFSSTTLKIEDSMLLSSKIVSSLAFSTPSMISVFSLENRESTYAFKSSSASALALSTVSFRVETTSSFVKEYTSTGGVSLIVSKELTSDSFFIDVTSPFSKASTLSGSTATTTLGEEASMPPWTKTLSKVSSSQESMKQRIRLRITIILLFILPPYCDGFPPH